MSDAADNSEWRDHPTGHGPDRGRDEIDFITGRRSGPTEGGVHLPDAARVREFERPAEEDERRALRWLLDVREHGGPLERAYAASVIQTLAYFEQEAPVDTRP